MLKIITIKVVAASTELAHREAIRAAQEIGAKVVIASTIIRVLPNSTYTVNVVEELIHTKR